MTTDPWPLRSSLGLGALPGQSVSVNLTGGAIGVLIEVREVGSPGQVVRRELATDPPLPRRVPRARPKPPAEIVTDLDILRRLRDHLSS